MATRKSGDGTRDMEQRGGDRPGSYAKTSGSRRKRKLKKGRSSMPPGESSLPPGELREESAEQPLDDALDVEGEQVEQRTLERVTRPEWGEGVPDLVDDLRRKPSSSRAPRKQLGPLGMDEGSEEEPRRSAEPHRSSEPRRLSTPRPASPSGRLNVVEINPTVENSNHERYEVEPENHPFGDPFADQNEPSEPPEPVRSRAYGREREGHAEQRSRHPAARQHELDEAMHEAELHGGRPSLSSVFDARASLRPSPPPPASSVSIVWWVVVSLLSAIIVAAGSVAIREAQRVHESAGATRPDAEGEDSAKVVEPAPVERAVEPAPAAIAGSLPAPSAPQPAPAAGHVPNPTAPAVATPTPITPRPAPVAATATPQAARAASAPLTAHSASPARVAAHAPRPVAAAAPKPLASPARSRPVPPAASVPEVAAAPQQIEAAPAEPAAPPAQEAAPAPEVAPPAQEPLPQNPYN